MTDSGQQAVDRIEEPQHLPIEREQAEWLVTYFRRRLAADPRNVDLRLNFGLFLIDIGRSSEALPLLREILTLQPNHLRAREALAQTDSQSRPRVDTR